ncbi:protein YagN, partial [Pseudomonas aeruginosa]
ALSSDSGDGSDPDPEPETFPSAFITTPTNSIMLKAFFANISITEVAK